MTALSDRASIVSSFTIIKGSMIEETYAVFRGWDFELSREDNLRIVRDTNSIGATSSNWLRDVYKVLHRRFDPNGRDRPLVLLAKADASYEIWKPLLLWHMTRDEYLVRDFLVNWVYPQFADGALRVHSDDLLPYLSGLHKAGLVEEGWQDSTLNRVATGLVRMAVDFGLMTGSVKREFTSYHLPEQSFLYLVHAMTETLPNARQMVESPDWRMYLMSSEDVERELMRLHQYRKLQYEVAGSMAQLTLPYRSAEAYAMELAA